MPAQVKVGAKLTDRGAVHPGVDGRSLARILSSLRRAN